MNLFRHYEIFGTVAGFVGKSSFEKKQELYECVACGKKHNNIRRLTCSKNCAKIYKDMQSTRKFVKLICGSKTKPYNYSDYTTEEFRAYINNKYGKQRVLVVE